MGDTGDSPSTKIFRGVAWACLFAAVAGLIAALIFRWDRIGHLNDPRWQTILSLFAFAGGAGMAAVQARGSARFPRTASICLLLIAFALIFCILLVWTDLKMRPDAWRFWWASVVGAFTATHIVWLRLAAPSDRRKLLRFVISASLVAGALLLALAVRPHILAPLGPAWSLMVVIALLMSAIGTILVWLRRPRVFISAASRRLWIALAGCCNAVVIVAAFYAGRLTAPHPAVFDAYASPLPQMGREELEFQLRTDLERLRIVAKGLAELRDKAAAEYAELRQARAAESRNHFRPEEEDRIRSMFMSYLAYRAALLRLVVNYAGYQSVHDPEIKARCFLIGYAAACMVYDASSKLVVDYRDDAVARKKLNEPEPCWGIPAGMFDVMYDNLLGRRHAELLAEMHEHYSAGRRQWREMGVLPESDLELLESLIDGASQQIAARGLDRTRGKWERAVARMRNEVYEPVYSAQTVLSTWIGDTRITRWEPLITRRQIVEMQGELRPGDILLERRNWFLSNAFLPGFWPHSAIYIGTPEELQKLGLLRREGDRWTSDDPGIRAHLAEYLKPAGDGGAHCVIEAVSEGVILNSLTESMHADYVAVLRPRITDEQRAAAVTRAFSHIGKPYDFEFDFASSDKLVCTEVVYRSFDGFIDFDLERIMGRTTLPALSIARKFAAERGKPGRQLDFVLFLDGIPADRRARLADEQTFCGTINRPRGFNE